MSFKTGSMLLKTTLLWLALAVSVSASAKEYVSHKVTPQGLTVTHDEGTLTLRALTPLSIEVIAQGAFTRRFPSFAKQPGLPPNTAVKVIESTTELSFSTKRLTARLNKTSMALSYYKDGKLIAEEESGYFEQATLQGFRFKLTPSEKLMGTGERVLGMDRRGHRLPLYNKAHYGYGTQSEQMNYSIPAVMSSNKYIILFDNPAKGAIDLGLAESNVLQFEATGGRQAYIFVAGASYPELINQYVKVTGTQPLPPRWALGNHASRFGYKSQQEVLSTIKRYEETDIPVDSIILDLYWFGKDIKGHMGNLDWDAETFPEPQKMIQTLADKGVKTTLITEPFILTTSKRWDEAVQNNILAKNIGNTDDKIFNFYFGETGLIDVFNQPAKEWFASIYKGLNSQGVAGVWGDLGEPEVHPADTLHHLSDWDITASGDEIHNVYGHQWAQLAYDSLIEAQPEVRPFMIMRAGYAGSQRLGFIPWTGDVSRSWDGLKPQPELTMQMSLLGLAYTHSDLGGFAGGETFDKEMYIRWLQYGVFQPIYRPHAQDNIAPEPVFHDRQTQNIIRSFIKLRYRLMPYNYSLAYQNSTTGMPLMRPMFFEDESNEALIDIADQFMWGDSFLVKPVTEPGVESVKVFLPKGQWTDFWTDKQYNITARSGEVVSIPVDLQTIPVLVRGGSIIPTVNDHNNATEYDSEQMRFDVYFDPQELVSSQTVFEDDGVSRLSIQNEQYELMSIKVIGANKNGRAVMTIDFDRDIKGRYTNMPEQRSISTVVHHWPNKPSDIQIDGRSIAIMVNAADFKLEQTASYYDKNTQQLLIKHPWSASQTRVSIN